MRSGCGGGGVEDWKDYLLQEKVPGTALTEVVPGREPSLVGCVVSVVEAAGSI